MASTNLLELLSNDLATSVDPVRFAASLGITCDPWQANALRSPHRRIQIVAARQSGKSLTCAIYALWFAIHHNNVTVLIVSPALRQSQLMFRSILDFYAEMEHKISVRHRDGLNVTPDQSQHDCSTSGRFRTHDSRLSG